ncbi:protein YibB [Campylobacter lari]|uniref:protein YibB n=1 Tax=Campylobacter lari TaxID=201 RepID=UPI001284C7B0|nr:protein YibB [Campylobacter lari]EAI5529497.1 protein YibB [Campylobacter lari]EAJ0323980.1 protein YibB [Campylobacter lari]EAJ0341404.1 protein YibB [Campylobacter lari]EAK0945207.1 protein YibB [Campylobacter lari]EAK0948672.1 protein YibB [Campylobacter lari]
MQNEITIVTAFYNIGRTTRGNDQYLSYFDFWSGLKNHVIIYTTEDMKELILEKRRQHCLEDKTTIIVKELKEFDLQTLNKIKETFKNYDQTLHRKNSSNIECVSPLYCYLMYLKPFFVCDAIERGITNENIMWLDFGFNHGDSFFINKDQFNFLLEKQENIVNDKINLFSIKDQETNTIPEIYYNMEPFLIGGLIYGNIRAWRGFKKNLCECMQCFLSFNMVDDDQIMFLWCTRNYPQNYNIIRCYEWFDSLFNFIPKGVKHTILFKRQNSKYYKLIKEEIKNNKNINLYNKLKLYFKYFYCKFIIKKYIEL